MPTSKRIGVGDFQTSPNARKYVNEVLDSGRLTYGPFSKRFEREWARLHEQRYAVFVNSGTSALHIALAAMKERLGWRDGSKVIVPATTFVASLNVILHNNLTPVLVDVDPDTWLIGHLDWAHDAVAIMPVNLYGAVVNSTIYFRAKSRNMATVTDSCETALNPYCASGDITAFSTYACHTICTGVGGLATTNDPEYAKLLRSLANHGRDGIYLDMDQPLGNEMVIAGRFRFERPGYSYRATELEAAIGVAGLEDWQDNTNRRISNVEFLRRELFGYVDFPKVRSVDATWMFLPMICRTRGERDSLVERLERENIETRPFLPLISQPYIKKMFGNLREKFPVANALEERAFYIGCDQYKTKEDLERIVSVFQDHFLLIA